MTTTQKITTHKPRTNLKKIGTLAALFFTAMILSGAAYYQISSLINTEVNTISDVNDSYGKTYGFKTVKQTQTTQNNGLIATTLTAETGTSGQNSQFSSKLTYLVDTIKKVNKNDDIINIHITGANETQKFNITYKAASSEDYKNGNLNPIIEMVKQLEDEAATTITEYNLNYTNTGTGKNVEVTGGVEGWTVKDDPESFKLKNLHAQLINITTQHLGIKNGDLYDITFSNTRNETAENIPFHFQSIFVNEQQKDDVLNMDKNSYLKLVNMSRPNLHQNVNIKEVKYYTNSNKTDDTLVLVIPDEGPEKLQETIQNLTPKQWSETILYPPSAFHNIIIRYEMGSSNAATIIGTYAQ